MSLHINCVGLQTREAGNIIGSLNVYNMYSKCYKGPQYTKKPQFPSTAIMLSGSKFFQHQTLVIILLSFVQVYIHNSYHVDEVTAPESASLLRSSVQMRCMVLQRFYAAERNEDVELSPPCVNGVGITTYMNRADVKTALHIADNLPEWSLCRSVGYLVL